MSIADESKTRLALHQSADAIGKSPSITPRQSWTRSAQSEWLSNFATASNLSENLKNPPSSSPPPIPLPRTKFLSLPSEVAAFKDQQLTSVFENNQKELKRSESALLTMSKLRMKKTTQKLKDFLQVSFHQYKKVFINKVKTRQIVKKKIQRGFENILSS